MTDVLPPAPSTPDLTPCPDTGGKMLHPQVDSGRGFTVDRDLLPTLDALWSLGVPTTCSCSGSIRVRHGLFGARHAHPGFIGVADRDGATTAFRWLDDQQARPVLLAEPDGHGAGQEYVVEFAPVGTWGQQPAGDPRVAYAAVYAVHLIKTIALAVLILLAVVGLDAIYNAV